MKYKSFFIFITVEASKQRYMAMSSIILSTSVCSYPDCVIQRTEMETTALAQTQCHHWRLKISNSKSMDNSDQGYLLCNGGPHEKDFLRTAGPSRHRGTSQGTLASLSSIHPALNASCRIVENKMLIQLPSIYTGQTKYTRIRKHPFRRKNGQRKIIINNFEGYTLR